jgi:hypothetical protein
VIWTKISYVRKKGVNLHGFYILHYL